MSRPQPRAPGSFSPLPSAASNISSSNPPQPPPTRPPPRRIDSSDSDDLPPPIAISKTRQQQTGSPAGAIYAQAPSQSNTSMSATTAGLSQQQQQHYNYTRPSVDGNRPRVVTQTHGSTSPLLKQHNRKHSATQGRFDSTLPSTSSSNLSQVGMSHGQASASQTALSASAIAAQAAVMSHQDRQQQQAQQLLHQQQQTRHRSQTVPPSGEANGGSRRGSGSRGPASPPMLSLTEASAPRETAFTSEERRQLDRLTSHSSAATAAANVVFPRSGHSSPSHSATPQQQQQQQQQQMPPPPPPPPEKPSKSEKAKVKLFSRPNKISTKGESKDKPLPSPGKIGHALSALQRGNFSTTSLAEPSNSQGFYQQNNSSAATIKPMDIEEKATKEKKHHFLSRQKQKLKDEYHLPLSSAASNSRPTDPNAPNSLYSFNVPASPGPSSSGFAKAKKDKKAAERSESRLEHNESFTGASDWPGPSSVPPLSQQSTMYDPVDPGKLGLHTYMSHDDAWPYLKARLLNIFEGEDLRLPVEDFNRVVQMHIQYCVQKRSPNLMLEDLRDLLAMGFSSLDRTLRNAPEDRLINTLVELWLFTFTSILPYLQSVFLPLDMEVSGCGTIMSAEHARDFWGGIMVSDPSSGAPARVTPVSATLDVRRLVLSAFRDQVVLPRHDTLKTIFSRLSLEFLPSSFANIAMASPIPESSYSTSPPGAEYFPSMAPRPGTAMSIDPSVGSYNSTSTTLLGEGSGGGSAGGRSRAISNISNVSFGSHGSDGGASFRPFTPSALGSVREQNVEDSKQVTELVGRMLQCMSVLSSLGGVGDQDDEEGSRRMVELCKMLKHNWLGRGRTGRNRMGIVGGRVRRESTREELRVA
ncbi:hypothetical protein N3K66_003363 [Trichothecium roseum]|uniref:Uncharacterized protein n=1 Tax=Trichothecium roseum TaxID=47278 RepID=A0ACC0V592_9HYPO|nr:hypothetical protein N3K66_003363 [Trichothecium roseum]